MTWLKEVALPVLGKGWDAVVALGKWAWDWVVKIGNTLWDPPPVAYKWAVLGGLAIFVSGGLTFAFVNSWFYKPTVEYLASFSWGTDDLDVVLPEHVSVLPPVAPAAPIPQPVKVCEDMSDTPHCVHAKPETEGTLTYLPEKEVIPLPVAKPKLDTKKKIRIYRREHKSYETVWGF